MPELTGQVSVKENLSLSDALLGCVEDFYYQPEGSVYYTEDTVQRVLCDLILLYVCGPALSTAVYGDPDQGVMADLYAENAAFIRVDDLISTASGMMRFLFWTYDVTIPAGGHVVLEATQHISPSCTQTRDEDGYLVSSAPYGFDFAPAFAGSPPLEAMELEVIHGDSLTVAESNFNCPSTATAPSPRWTPRRSGTSSPSPTQNSCLQLQSFSGWKAFRLSSRFLFSSQLFPSLSAAIWSRCRNTRLRYLFCRIL